MIALTIDSVKVFGISFFEYVFHSKRTVVSKILKEGLPHLYAIKSKQQVTVDYCHSILKRNCNCNFYHLNELTRSK